MKSTQDDRAWTRSGPRILCLALCVLAGPALAHFGPLPVSLVGAPVPEVPGLTSGPEPIVVDQAKAIVLGKALFWDVNVGSDRIACASCHFHAGADRRVKNQLSPTGKDPLVPDPVFDDSPAGRMRGPNYRLRPDDFPFHQLEDPVAPLDPFDPLAAVTYSSDDVVSSSGTFGGIFEAVSESDPVDTCARTPDPVFHVWQVGTRLVEPRNAPTVINAVFNHRNLWDGAANNVFNGSSQWGDRDPAAGVWERTDAATVERKRLRLINSALASQALGPPLSDVEMGCNGRRFPDLGRKLADRAPLEQQNVHWEDSVLGPLALSTAGKLEPGLATTYRTLVEEAFDPRYWDYAPVGEFGAPPGGDPYDQYEANFAMFFALALQLYQATLISDDSPFDRSDTDALGVPIDLSESAQNGFQAFRDAHCNLCHIGATTTPASVVTNAILVESNPEAFGDNTFVVSTTRNVITRTPVLGGTAVVDTGFASNGSTPEEDDPGLGGVDPFGNPLSFADQFLELIAGNPGAVVDPYVDEIRPCDFDLSLARDQAQPHPSFFTQVEGVIPQTQDTEDCFLPESAYLPTPAAAAAELASPDNTKMRSASLASFKVPTLRNVELTGPYMHNGSMATLDQVLEFYTRGGNFDNFAKQNATVFPQIDLQFFPDLRDDIVAFLVSLTDDRVRFERAPFDHPELPIPHGHVGDEGSVQASNPVAPDLGTDELLVIPAVGASGRAEPLQPFEVFLTVPEPSALSQGALALVLLLAWRAPAKRRGG